MRRCEIIEAHPGSKFFTITHNRFRDGDQILMLRSLRMLDPTTMEPIEADKEEIPFDDGWSCITASNSLSLSFFNDYDQSRKIYLESLASAGRRFTLEFNDCNDYGVNVEDFQRAVLANRAFGAIDEMWQRMLRPAFKHGYNDIKLNELMEKSDEVCEAIEKLSEIYREVLNDEDIPSWLLY